VQYLYSSTGIKPNPEIWKRFMPYAGMLNVDEVDNIRQAWTNVAKSLGISLEELYKSIMPVRALFAIGDHTRNLLFAIHDGALPSNVGGGYNLRNILRRCYSLINEFELDLDLYKVFEIHANEIGDWFTELKEFGSLFNVLDIERQRYRDTQSKNLKFVQRELKKQEKILEPQLLDWYVSKGVTPQIVHQIDPSIAYPEDFYMKAQEIHERRQFKERPRILEANVPPTRMLYYEDSYASASSFDATVLAIVDNWVVLNQTHFYPEGGGQIADTGTLNGNRVKDTQKYNEQIFHQIEDVSTFQID